MAYLSDDELLDTEGGFTGWDDGTGAGAEETLEQALAEERLAELESELEQDEHPIDYEAELEDEEEEVALVSDKRLKREMRAEAIRRLEGAARTEKDFRAVLDKPTIYWDFHSLLGIQMMFSFMLVDGDQPLRLCKHCQKVFLGSQSNAAFCSPRCKNQYNVYKSRGKNRTDGGDEE